MQKLERNFNPPWGIIRVLLTFLITLSAFLGFSLIVGLGLKYLHYLGLIDKIGRTFFVTTVWGDLLMLFYFALLGAASYFVILKRISGSKIAFFIDFPGIKKDMGYALAVYFFSFLGAFLLGIFVLLGIGFAAFLFHQDPVRWLNAYSQGLNMEQARITAHLGVVKIILLVFIAPVFEEVFFRGCLYGAIRRNHSFIFSLIVSSIFFALVHGYFFNFINILFMGIIASWIYEKRRSLTAPIFFHFLWNLMVLSITVLGSSKGV
ncbi:MAG: type II CAAX endopeptidase family protein [Candidatus Ratteibacteria bacterium]|nr:type II CAAX endopeptidase family protein [Candidatus Ratteibacteria bacterium]